MALHGSSIPVQISKQTTILTAYTGSVYLKQVRSVSFVGKGKFHLIQGKCFTVTGMLFPPNAHPDFFKYPYLFTIIYM